MIKGAAACQHSNCTCVSNQQWTWAADGNVLGRMSDLCLDAGSGSVLAKPCDGPANNGSRPQLPYCDRALPPDQRAAALVAAANASERIDNLAVGDVGFPSLNVPAPVFGEALHGVCASCGRAAAGSTGCATSFPHATAMGASFNRTLWTMAGDVIGLEGRALRNEKGGGGVTYFAPKVNLYRDPRWGRGALRVTRDALHDFPSAPSFQSGNKYCV